MKLWAAFLLTVVVAGCGGVHRFDRADSGTVTRFSSGPISRACLSSDRRARNARLCGCIQTVANQSLSGPDQARTAPFFSDPQSAHDTWISQSRRDDLFWDRYRAFADRSEAACQLYSS